MRAALIFKLPEEKEDHELAVNGGRLRAAVDNYDEALRRKTKYENKNYIRIDEARQLLRECLGEYDL